jgi:hypothetical protein
MIRRFNEDFEKFEDMDYLVFRYFAFDWDDNILHMPTQIHMEQKAGDKWLPIDVSTSEFATLRTDTENYRILGNNTDLAFSEFRDNGPRGSLSFQEDVLRALKESKFAPAWDNFLKCLSEGAIFSIITARGHEPSTIKKSVEYVIDNYLTITPSMNPGRTLADEMFQNLRKFKFYFDELSGNEERELKGKPSSNPIVQEYLSQCDFFGVSSQDFAKKFGEGSAANPEESKIKAVSYCIDKCMNFAKKLEEKIKRPVKVKFGMSDDDPKNSAHIMDYFREKSGLSKFLSLYFFYTGKDKQVGEKSLKSGEKTSFKPVEVQENPLGEGKVLSFSNWNLTETSNQAIGMESSTLSMRDNMTKRLYPSNEVDPYLNQRINQIGFVKDLTKDTVIAFKKSKKRKKK